MFKICTYSLLLIPTKHRECLKEASKQTPNTKNSTAPGPCPPVLKFLDPPLLIPPPACRGGWAP